MSVDQLMKEMTDSAENIYTGWYSVERDGEEMTALLRTASKIKLLREGRFEELWRMEHDDYLRVLQKYNDAAEEAKDYRQMYEKANTFGVDLMKEVDRAETKFRKEMKIATESARMAILAAEAMKRTLDAKLEAGGRYSTDEE